MVQVRGRTQQNQGTKSCSSPQAVGGEEKLECFLPVEQELTAKTTNSGSPRLGTGLTQEISE